MYVIPRTSKAFISQRPELDAPGLYILTGVKDERPTAYIGQSDSFKSRIQNHLWQKPFWKTAFALVSNGFSSDDVKYLEYKAIPDAQNGNMEIAIDNVVVPHKPHIDEADEATMLHTYEIFKLLAEFAGCNVFAKQTEDTKYIDLFIKSKLLKASGKFNQNTKEFIVLKDSEIAPSEVASFKDKEQRQKKIAESAVLKDGKLKLVTNLSFKSPSGASCFVLGRSSNGFIDWMDGEGKSLRIMY